MEELRKNNVKHCKMVCRFELDLDLVQRYSLSSLTRHWTDKVDVVNF